MASSEFNDEYQDWLEGEGARAPRGPWFERTVAELSLATPACLEKDATVDDAVALMNARRESAVLIVERERVVGIFTERDVLTRVVPQGLDARRTKVGAVMTAEPQCFGEGTLLSAAMRTLSLEGYHHLPVLDRKGRPKAVVSLQAVVRAMLDVFPREIMNAPPEGEPRAKAKEGA